MSASQLLPLAAALTVAGICNAQCEPLMTQKLVATDGRAGDWFGWSAAASGHTAIVGAVYDDDRGSRSGSAYILNKVAGEWRHTAKVIAFDGTALDRFSRSVSISDGTAFVGAPYHDSNGADSGAAYVVSQVAGFWVATATLTPSDGAPGDRFGLSVSVSGDAAISGAYFNDHSLGTDAGAAYVFERGGDIWTQATKLIATDGAPGDWFGFSVSISGDAAVVGAVYDDHRGVDSGSAYIFERIDGEWTQTAKLSALDGAAHDRFGWVVSISGATALVGAPSNADYGTNTGSAYVFEKIDGNWTQTAKLLASTPAADDWFGYSVSVNGDAALVGSPYDDDLDDKCGSAYLFERMGGVWTETAKLTAFDGAAEDEFGISVSVSGDTVLVGAQCDDDMGGDSGAVYAYRLHCCVDMTRDVVVDTRDFIAFLNAWAAGDPIADWDGSGTIDTQDITAFLYDWAAGC